MNAPGPPRRAPHYFDNESQAWPLRQRAINLIGTLSGWVKQPLEFKGSANGRVWREADFPDRAQMLFTSNLGDGAIQLSVHKSNWVLAELSVGGEIQFRAWIEETYEEKEFWPDSANGVIPPGGDAPGRISKRGG